LGFEVIGQNLLDEFTMASPAIHRDSLLIRTATTLYESRNSTRQCELNRDQEPAKPIPDP
jgi:hypothetical protein